MRHAANELLNPNARIMLGPDIHQLSDEAFANVAPKIDIFAEVEPNQKEKIVLASEETWKCGRFNW